MRFLPLHFSNRSTPFVHPLRNAIDDLQWTSIHVAVAFCRMSGLRLLNNHIVEFIQREDTRLTIIVGIDSSRGGTSREALERLMHWRNIDPERVRILISHYPDNYPHENFHPKVYSFSNAENAQVFVGSNNLT